MSAAAVAGPGLGRFSINQMTVKQLDLPELVAACGEQGVTAVGLWREPVREYGVKAAHDLFAEAGIAVTSLCRGGFFTAPDRQAVLDDNRAAIDEAAGVGTDTLVLVSGGLPEGGGLVDARARIAEALAELAPYAADRGVRLAIEPLHPMYAADRCAVSTLGQALDLAEPFDAATVGVVVDTYHLWWDERVDRQIAEAGAAGRIHCFQLADWVTPLPAGVLTGRGQIGDGCIDMAHFRRVVDAAGYEGPIEVEIFNEAMWARDGREVLRETADRYRAVAAD
ncbi:sugar phosphate isomerase/epimerase family protein [Streptomyces bohaiensis]|uniref:sugar phosphate isomerase/epimerase family protein n=1 Tax=Streptomyces bohaiensis TaxID=1431344 RepID=UPI001ADDE147|nr:sugar phosphate isomerase/epimerase family protein [Streptomyces bohaiensis]